jgi:hypothetical protein
MDKTLTYLPYSDSFYTYLTLILSILILILSHLLVYLYSLLKPSDNPLYGFDGKGTFPVGKIELPLSFGVAPNARSEQVTFDIVDMVYPYNAIMGRGSINKFEAAIHRLYLCMKIPGPQGVITVYGNQQTARNIERDFVPGQRNVHYLMTQREVSEATPQPPTSMKRHSCRATMERR